jgi:hypothetical protein
VTQSSYGGEQYVGANQAPQQRPLPETPPVLPLLIPLLVTLLALAVGSGLPLALLAGVVSAIGVAFWRRRAQ